MSVYTYGVIAAVILGIGIAAFFVEVYLHGLRRKTITAIVFWTLGFCVVAMVPLLTPVTVYSYGLMFAMAVLICSLLLAADAQRKNINADIIFDLVFWTIVGGIIGARLLYIILNYPFFIENPLEIIMIQNGGLVWQGGLILGAIMGASFIEKKKLALPQILDLSAPYLALGQSIGRIGCFLNGCCYGKEVAWGIFFPVHNAHLHPTQLYLSAGLFLIFLILKRYQKFSQIPGLVFASYLILEAALRFGVEFFRADHKALFFGLSIYQFVSLGILIFAFGFAYAMLIKHSSPDNLS